MAWSRYGNHIVIEKMIRIQRWKHLINSVVMTLNPRFDLNHLGIDLREGKVAAPLKQEALLFHCSYAGDGETGKMTTNERKHCLSNPRSLH